MARIEVPVDTIIRAGLVFPSSVGSDATDFHFTEGNDGHIFFYVSNNGASPETITFYSVKVVDGLDLEDEVVTINNGDIKLIGPFNKSTFNQTYNDGVDDHLNSILFDPSVSTDLQINAFKLPSPSPVQ